MTNEAAPLGPARLWRDLTIDQRVALSAALWADEESVPQQVEAVQLIARQLRFRPQSVLTEPVEKRIRQLANLHTVSESVANRALVVYHLGSQRPMLEAFLTRLGISHEHGMIADIPVTAPDPAALRDAANALATEFPADSVRLYFRTLAAQDPETWGALAGITTEILPS
ncbi:MAG: hypothetical protein NT151_04235 [Acidobacteria bacterium]|nr:hypothetical protein [Acidobacteriota bacterium]